MNKQTIAIFGSGYVGSYLNNIETLKTIMYNKRDHMYDHADNLLDILRSDKPDYVINCCGYTGRPNVDACESDRQSCWNLNVNLAVTMAIVCKSLDIPFIHVSSGCIYTGYDNVFTEESEPNFGLTSDQSSWYSKTKHAAEYSLKDLSAYVLRIRMPFCADDHERNFLNKVLKYDNLIDYRNSMTCIEDFAIFIENFIQKIHESNPKIRPGVYNVCNPGSISIKDIVRLFNSYGKVNASWKFVDIESLNLAANRSNCVLDCTKIEKSGLNLPDVSVSIERCIKSLCS